MKSSKFLLIALFLIAILFDSCGHHEVTLKDPSQTLLDSLSMQAMNTSGDTAKHPDIIQPASKGIQWKTWESWFKNCPENQTFKKNIVYLGTGSNKRVGFILSKDVSLDKWDFFKVNKDDKINDSFIDPGKPVESCNLTQMKNFSIDMLVGGNVLSSVNASLGAIVSNAKKITLKSGKWRIESVNVGPFMAFVNASKDPQIVQYREALLNKNNVVLTKVLKVSGFEMEITAKDSIGANLTATLQNGFKVNVVAPDSTHKIGFTLNFKKGTNNTITVSSTGEFSLFAQASKGTEL